MKYIAISVCGNRTLMKEIKAKPNKRRDNSYSQTGRFNIVNMSVFPHLMYRFNAITTKIPAEYSVDITNSL